MKFANRKVLDAIIELPGSVGTLAHRTGMSPAAVKRALLGLQVQGHVVQSNGQWSRNETNLAPGN